MGFCVGKKLIETKRNGHCLNRVSMKLTFISFGDVPSSCSTDL